MSESGCSDQPRHHEQLCGNDWYYDGVSIDQRKTGLDGPVRSPSASSSGGANQP